MKILLICPLWGHFGGQERYFIDVVEELTKRGHTVSVIYEQATDHPVTSGAAAKIRADQISALTSFHDHEGSESVQRLQTVLRRESPDVIFFSSVKNVAVLSELLDFGNLVNMAHHGWLFCLRDARTIYWTRNACYRRLDWRCYLKGCFLKKSGKQNGFPLSFSHLGDYQTLLGIYRKIGRHLVASRYMKDLFLQHGFRDDQVTVIKLFSDLPDLTQVPVGAFSEPQVLFIGRIDRYKGVDCLVRALRRLRARFSASIIGEGVYRSYCQRLTERLGLEAKVKFLGWLPKEETARYFQEARLIVVPSLVPEALGLAGIEAMSYGKPVVAFDNGGITDWLQDGKTGYLVPPQNVALLARRMDDLLLRPQLAAAMGAQGRKFVEENYQKDAHVHSLIKFLKEVSRKGCLSETSKVRNAHENSFCE